MHVLICRLYYDEKNKTPYIMIDQKVFQSSIVKTEDLVLNNGVALESYEVGPYSEVDALPPDCELSVDVKIIYIGDKNRSYEEILQIAAYEVGQGILLNQSENFKLIKKQTELN